MSSLISLEGISEVEQIIRQVNEQVVVPRFGALDAGDVAMKGPMDPVTIADREAEDLLTATLTAFLPGSVVVGEEAVSADAGVLAALEGADPVWIIDPIDGTRNFVAGSPRFSTLVALAHRGELVASWTLAPVLGRTGTALAGHGAWVDGAAVRLAGDVPDGRGLVAGLDVATPKPIWRSAADERMVGVLRDAGAAVAEYDSIGVEYLDVASGRRAAVVITWENCWDHAAGLLLVAEAGGHSANLDGGPFRLAGGNRLPFVVTPSAAVSDALRGVIATAS